VVGYEALGRGAHPALARNPIDLFRQADVCGLSVELSQCLRRAALVSARKLPRHLPLFLNVHPHELSDPTFLPSIERLQAANHLRRPLVAEIAEASVASVEQMRVIVRGLASNMVRFAYDDFGVGQARLLDITDVPPHFLKLDRSLVAGIGTDTARRDVISALARVVRPACVQVIAEGIESETVAMYCAEAGCDLGQGFLWGLPDQPAASGEADETLPSTSVIVR
jgi:EAL domain-containing protein (putative c-di-GMP-specific phosphodiesterase class I)